MFFVNPGQVFLDSDGWFPLSFATPLGKFDPSFFLFSLDGALLKAVI